MPKLTADIFSTFPEQMQEDVLKQYGADQLNNLYVVDPDTELSEDEYNRACYGILKTLDRPEAMMTIQYLLSCIWDSDVPPPPPGGKDVGRLMLFAVAVQNVREFNENQGEDNE